MVTELNDRRVDIKTLEEDLDELRNKAVVDSGKESVHLNTIESLQTDINEVRNNLHDKEARISNLEEELEREKNAKESFLLDIENLEKDIKVKNETIELLQKDLEDKFNEMAMAEKEMIDKDERNEKKTEELMKQVQEKDCLLLETIENGEHDIEKLKADYQAIITEYKQEVDKLEKTVDHLTEDIRKLKGTEKEYIDQLILKEEQIQTSRKVKLEEDKNNEQKITSLQNKLEENKNRFEEVQNIYNDRVDNLQNMNTKYKEEIENKEKEMNNLKKTIQDELQEDSFKRIELFNISLVQYVYYHLSLQVQILD